MADQPVFGKVSVTAVLTAPGEVDSPSATRTYTVIPPAPAVSSLRDGKHLRQDALPSDHLRHRPSRCRRAPWRWTGWPWTPCWPVPAAELGSPARRSSPGSAQTLAGSARWSVPFPAGLATGAHTLTVTQTIDGVASPPAAVAFTRRRRARFRGLRRAASRDTGSVQPQRLASRQSRNSRSTRPELPPDRSNRRRLPPRRRTPPSLWAAQHRHGTATRPGTSGQLASTGAGGLLPVAGLGAGVLLLGAAFVAFGRRRAVR